MHYGRLMPGLRRVGLNLLYLLPQRVGGTEIYARRLVAAMAEQRPDVSFIAFAAREAMKTLGAEGWPPNVTLRGLPVHAANKPARIAAELTLLPLAAKRARVDVLHSLGTTSPLLAPCPTVVTVHDLIYEHYPQTFPTAARWGLRALVGPAARRATRVLADSRATRGDVIDRLHVPPERVDVVYIGFGMRSHPRPTAEAELRNRLGLAAGPVVLCVSAALEHKNLPRLIDAFGQLVAQHLEATLVIVGHAGRGHAALEARAAGNGVGDRVVLTGWLSDADLEGLYALARCAVYPSLHEGFGLPVLEAMARGLPLASSNATSLPEVAGDAAELFEPRDTGAIAAAMRRLLEDDDHAATLVRRGYERVRDFTWERCAQETLASYERALVGCAAGGG
jgi:glycosyltransferase involved in cell wall biosynthesis